MTDDILTLTDREIIDILDRIILFQPNAECSALALELALRNPACALAIFRQSPPVSDAEFWDLIDQVMSFVNPEAQNDFLTYILTTHPREREALQLYKWIDSKEIH